MGFRTLNQVDNDGTVQLISGKQMDRSCLIIVCIATFTVMLKYSSVFQGMRDIDILQIPALCLFPSRRKIQMTLSIGRNGEKD